MQDLRYAFRLMLRQPVFAALVVGTLALGIGASTTMFSVVNGVLRKPLPYGDPAALVWMYGAFSGNDSASVSPPDFLDYRDRNRVFERLGAMGIAPQGVTVTGSGTPVRLQASRVSADLMTVLGVPPVLGRDFARSDEKTSSPSILISNRLWQERFGGAPDAIGRAIVVDGRGYTVVGVMPAGFVLPYDSFIRLTDPVDLFLPIGFDDPEAQIRRFHMLRVIGRLPAAATIQQAQSQMDVIARQLAAAYPENESWHLRLLPLHERIVGAVRPALRVLMGAVALLLLVSCANVASLLLARGSSREPEIALRGALGASRGRIVRQLLVEGLVLSFAGAAAGLLVTGATIRAVGRLGTQFPRLDTIALEPQVILFAAGAAVAATLLFALVPAMQAARAQLTAAIGTSRTATHDRVRRFGQRTLVVAQLCVAAVLLAGAAVLVKGFMQLIAIDPGFQASNVTLTAMPLQSERYSTDARYEAFYGALLERLASSPGVETAALATSPPLSGANDTVVYREGRAPTGTRDRGFAQIRWVRGDYFGALGIPMVAGRRFDDRVDRAGAPDAAVISAEMAREHFGSENPIGQRLVVDLGTAMTAEVVGVAGDVRIFGQANEAPAMVYMSALQHPVGFMQLVIKSAVPAGEVASAIRRHVQALDPAMAVARTDTLEELLSGSVAQPRFAMLLIASFAGLALLLTLVGLYGTLAYLVSQRQREFGIRLAVGATRGTLRRMVLGQGLVLVAIGVPLGLIASLFATRLGSALLLEVPAADPVVLAGVAVLLTLTSLAAMLGPAHRAARADPLAAIRAE